MPKEKGMPQYKADFKSVKRRIIKTARELYYSKNVIAALKRATTEDELMRIMRNARIGKG